MSAYWQAMWWPVSVLCELDAARHAPMAVADLITSRFSGDTASVDHRVPCTAEWCVWQATTTVAALAVISGTAPLAAVCCMRSW